MKKYLILFICLNFFNGLAQDFKNEWREVIQFELDGKVKSASAVVDEIYKKSKKKNIEDQIIKCFLYQSKFLKIQDENAKSVILKNLKSEIANSKFSKKALLNYIYIDILQQYYQRNLYKLKTRTNLEQTNSNDLETWTEKDFSNKFDELYGVLLKDEKYLRADSILKFGAIFEISPYTNAKAWSVYDFLQTHVIKYYFKNLYFLNNKKYQNFVTKLLSNSADFIQIDADTISVANFTKGLKILQNNEKFYLQNNNENLYKTQYDRMKLFYNHINDKAIYINELYILEKKVKDNFLRQDISVDFANYYISLTSKENKKNYYSEVLSLIDTILGRRENPNAKVVAEGLKEQIIGKKLTINIPSEIYPQQNYRAFVEFKNVDSLTVSYYKIPVGILQKLSNTKINYSNVKNQQFSRDSIALDFIKKNNPLKIITKILPPRTDHFEYSTELVMEPLATGSYLLLFETKNNFNNPKKAFAYKTLQVSNINYVQEREDNNDSFQLFNRKTGEPIENAVITNDELAQKTNSIGKTRFALTTQHSNLYSDLLFVKEKDTLYNSYYKSRQILEKNRADFEAKAMVLFDRAIYRPGQKVFFKGYIFQKKENVKSVVPNLTVHVIISDENRNEIKAYDIQTNEFGSFTGEYEIPKNVLTGDFSVTIEKPNNYELDTKFYDKKDNEHSFWDNADFKEYESFNFKVEEYKRPTFEITFDKIKENYTIGDSIFVRGNARNLAGSNLTNAKVSYTLTRNVKMKNGFFNNGEDEVDGETTTDGEGNFTINFHALEGGVKEDIQLITFYLKLSITDLNGETRTASTSVKVGAEMLKLDTVIEEEIIQGEKNTLRIKATTLNGFPIEAKGTITFIERKQQNFLIKRDRFPELNSIDKDIFAKLFPFEAYDENAVAIEEIIVKSMGFNTEKSTEIDLAFLNNFKTSNYKVKLEAHDQNKNAIYAESNFTITTKNKKATNKSLFVVQQIESKTNNFIFEIKSLIPDLYVTTRIYADATKKLEIVSQLKNGVVIVKIPKKGIYEKEINFHFSTIWENTYFEDEIFVSIENAQPLLDFEVVSMRNKIEPGSLENWSFVLKNFKEQSEVLASMYDSSLDQFAISNWESSSFDKRKFSPKVIYKKYNWYNNSIRFNNLYFQPQHSLLNVSDPKINKFGFTFNNSSKYESEQYLKKIKANLAIPANANSVYGLVLSLEDSFPIPGVNVSIAGTNRGTQTDFNGRYEIEMTKGETLVFSYLGFKSKSIIFDKERQINILLEDDDKLHLEAVVVQGYSVFKTRKTSIVSSATIENESFNDSGGIDDFNYYRGNIYAQNPSFIGALQGRVAGGNITTSSSEFGGNTSIIIRGTSSIKGKVDPLYIIDGIPLSSTEFRELNPDDINSITVLKNASAIAIYGARGANGVIIITTQMGVKELTQVKTRTNFNETAFFYPNLTTDSKGKINFSFTSPESLTKWRLRLFGHNKKAETGYFQTDIISQKDILIMPNMPRFVREKDKILLATKVVNMTNEALSGNAVLLLFDAANNTAVDSITMNADNVKIFNCKSKESVVVKWMVSIPEGLQGLRYKVIAKSGTTSDGEENILPVLTDKILITESIPIWVKGNTAREFTLENLKKSTSTTLQHQALTLEYTSNPVWIALQSLPYLMTYEHECSEQVFAKYFANCLAEKIITSNPKIENLFQKWHDDKSVSSKLQMNDELKSIVLAETPWLLDAESDAEKNKRLAILMDLNTLKQNNVDSFKKLEEKMLASGGFPWFSGGIESRFITQHILAGIGRLTSLFPQDSLKYKSIISKALPNLDSKFVSNYTPKTKMVRPSTVDLNYLYMRSFYLKNYPVSSKNDSIIKLQLKQCKENWLSYSLYEKGILALTMNRFNEKDFAKKIITSLKETVSNNDEIGMYWIENTSGYSWYQSNISTQALLIEAFAEIDKDKEAIDAMKVWLLKNKQTQQWSTTKSTTEAIYALMMQGSDWVSQKENTKIKIGNEQLLTQKLSTKDEEQNAGYLKIKFDADEITPKLGTVTINNKSEIPGFGGLYWQYFESLENIKKDSTQSISIDKKLFKKVNTAKGDELIAFTNKTLKVGDLLTVRLIIKASVNMEFLHLKDLRASCLEPIDVISKHERKSNLSYYKSTKDVATHFFFDELNKGTYVVEYDLRVTNQGDFNDGISTLQSMYAPEFTAHSESTKVIVKQ